MRSKIAARAGLPRKAIGANARGHRGFTLVELLIVVVVVAILAAIAFPAYRDYVLRSNRAVAKSVLTQVADRQEQFFVANKRYSDDLEELGFEGDPLYIDRRGNRQGGSAGAVYAINVNVADTTFTVVAEAQNTQTKDKCSSFTINAVGQRTATGTASDCW